MSADTLTTIAHWVGFHGLRGEVKLRPLDADPDWLDSVKTLHFCWTARSNESTSLILPVVRFRMSKSLVLAYCKGWHDRTAVEQALAEPLAHNLKVTVQANAKDIPPPDGVASFWCKDLLGLAVWDVATQSRLGVVTDLMTATRAGDGLEYLEIKPDTGKASVVVPFQHHFFPTVELAEKRLWSHQVAELLALS